MMIEELDLNILKTITQDKVQALTFSYRYDHSLFAPEAQRFGKCVLDYIKSFRSPPTKRTLIDRYKDNQDLVNHIGDVWDQLDALEYDQKEYTYDVGRLKRRFQETAVDEIRVKAENEHPENPEEFFKSLSLSIQKVVSLDLERTHIQKPVGDHIEEFKDQYDARQQRPDDVPEIKTKYSMMDAITGGLAPGELIMLGGETNSGKSMLLNNMARQLWMQENTIDTPSTEFVKGFNVLYFSLEMSYNECFIRFLASVANVPQRGLQRPHENPLSPEEEERVAKAFKFIEEYQNAGYYFDIVDVPRNLTIEEVELRYHDALLRYHPDIIVVDYMGLMHSIAFSKEPDWLKMGAYAASLHEFARAYNCVVITAAQLTDLKRNSNSQKGEDSKRVGTHRWGRSSLIMHHVNLGIQIETRPNERVYPDMQIHAVKNRKGPLGQGSLVKNFANALLIDVPFDETEIPGDVSANIPDLIKAIQEAKNKLENSTNDC
jgi:replicative DNA helicase